MEGDVFGVRITPPVLQFYNTEPNVRFELPINVLNVSKSSKNIRYYGPKSEVSRTGSRFDNVNKKFKEKREIPHDGDKNIKP